jgi:hypothetical protein
MVPVTIEDLTRPRIVVRRDSGFCGIRSAAPAFTVPRHKTGCEVGRAAQQPAAAHLAARRRALDAVVHVALSFGWPIEDNPLVHVSTP